MSRPIAVMVLYHPEYHIFIWSWDIKGMYVGAPFIDRADNLDGALTAFKIQKAVNAKNRADN